MVGDALKKDCLSAIVAKAKAWTKECRKTKTREILRRHQEEQNVAKKQLVMVKIKINYFIKMQSFMVFDFGFDFIKIKPGFSGAVINLITPPHKSRTKL